MRVGTMTTVVEEWRFARLPHTDISQKGGQSRE